MSYSLSFLTNYTALKRVLLHVVFWMIIFFMHLIAYNRIDIQNSWGLLVKDIIALLSIFYITGYVIIPRWLMKGKFLKCVFWGVIAYAFWAEMSLFSSVLIQKFLTPNPRLGIYLQMVIDAGVTGPFTIGMIPFYLFDFIFLVSLPIGMKVMQAFVSVRGKKVELELENTELALNNTKLNLNNAELQLNNVQLELAFLKSQINPHFLFNTLNNIEILVSDNDPRGEETLQQLSGIMYYLLHESNRPMVTLEEEYTFLKNYIALEKLRLRSDVPVDVQLTNDEEGYLIVPLIIFPFVENAFKHGPKANSRQAGLKVNVDVRQGQMHTVVSNKYTRMEKPADYVGGIGLENVRKRLELNYTGKYLLDIKEGEQEYTVLLTIDLKPSEIFSEDEIMENKYMC